MKYKVAELEGSLLDAAVAKADGWSHQEVEAMIAHGPDGPDQIRYLAASTSCALGGPIIERERIASFNSKGVWFAGYEIGSIAEQYYDSESVPVLFEGSEASGPTLLVAAMRAYVSSRFGEEVELP